MKNCKICGKSITSYKDNCSFCNAPLLTQNARIEDIIVTPGLNDEFKDNEINIEFNLRNIVNELDYKKDYENNAIELAPEEFQYLQSDITEKNIEKVKENIKFYNDELNNFIKNEKNRLETAGAEDLQQIIAKFNNVVNTCNKYKKFINNKDIQISLDNIIFKYNKEINYIKKYFVLPLYEADKILAASRLAKNLINISSICIMYFFVSKLPFINTIFTFIVELFKDAGKGMNTELALCNINAFVSFMGSLGLTEVIFAYYISCTIKNRNFKVDKHKNFEPIYYFVPVIFVLSLYSPLFSYFFNGWFIFYIIKTVWVSFITNRFSPQWLMVKFTTILISVLTILDVVYSLANTTIK